MLFPLEKLLENRPPLITVRKDTSLCEALEIMTRHDYSQLPVVDDAGKLTGIVSEQSISRRYFHVKGRIALIDMAVEHCQTQASVMEPAPDKGIIEVLNALKSTSALMIVKDRRPIAILTDYDTTLFLRQSAEGLLLAQDIEVNLRQSADIVFADDGSKLAATVRAFGQDRRDPTRAARDYDKLTFGELLTLVQTDGNWAKFAGVFEPKVLFERLLSEVREIRNDLAHYRRSMNKIDHDVLKGALHWVETRPSIYPIPKAKQYLDPAEFAKTAAATLGKYERLGAWLSAHAKELLTFAIPFSELEIVIGGALPPSALEHRSWWANDSVSHRQSITWLDAGWRVADVELDNKVVTFQRKQ
jgi:CBS domain-containing protein